VADTKVVEVDTREQALDVAGQEIMTADKVTLRMNALVTYRITDARKAVHPAESSSPSLLDTRR
jgi:regulator of protease activity HflC (stomatin/prohibitin superfamily)